MWAKIIGGLAGVVALVAFFASIFGRSLPGALLQIIKRERKDQSQAAKDQLDAAIAAGKLKIKKEDEEPNDAGSADGLIDKFSDS